MSLGLRYWRQIIFFTVPLSKIIFFSQNQSKEIFFEKIPSPPPPPPEYQMDRALGLAENLRVGRMTGTRHLFYFGLKQENLYGIMSTSSIQSFIKLSFKHFWN